MFACALESAASPALLVTHSHLELDRVVGQLLILFGGRCSPNEYRAALAVTFIRGQVKQPISGVDEDKLPNRNKHAKPHVHQVKILLFGCVLIGIRVSKIPLYFSKCVLTAVPVSKRSPKVVVTQSCRLNI